MAKMEDFDLERFVTAQTPVFAAALAELKAGLGSLFHGRALLAVLVNLALGLKHDYGFGFG